MADSNHNLAWVLCAALACAAAGAAPYDATAPINLEAASSDFDYRNNTLVFRRVKISQGGMQVEADEAELVDPRPHPGGGNGEVSGMRERGGVGRFGDLDLRTAAVDRALAVRAGERRDQPMGGQPANALSEEGGVPVARGDELRGCNG